MKENLLLFNLFALFFNVMFTCFVLGGQVAVSDDWPQWRGPNRNGQIDVELELTSQTKFSDQWAVEIGTGFSSIVVSDGLLYSMGNQKDNDIVWCLNALTGDEVWRHAYECPLDPNLFEGGPTATPTIAGGMVYTLSRQGDLFCFAAKTGEIQWQVNLKEKYEVNVPTWGFSGSPLVIEDKVVLNVGSAGLCLDAKNGELIWNSGNDQDAGYSTPLLVHVGDTKLAVMLSAKSLNAVDLKSGQVRWSVRWITRYGINAADPVQVDEEHLLVSSGYSKGVALIKFDADTAEQIYRSRELSNQMSPGVMLGGELYAINGDEDHEPELMCIDPLTGKAHWSEKSFGTGALLNVGGKLLFLSGSGDLHVLDVSASGYQTIVNNKVIDGKSWTPIACVDLLFYVRNAAGLLKCIKITQP